jgi:hypothetical protein
MRHHYGASGYAPVQEQNEQWRCGANKALDPPQDCNWPLCGCDPYADKVIAALAEAGLLKEKTTADRSGTDD